jgi:hypothetical protein
MKRFRFRPYKVHVKKWRYQSVELEECTDVLNPAIMCADEEDADFVLGLIEQYAKDAKEGS